MFEVPTGPGGGFGALVGTCATTRLGVCGLRLWASLPGSFKELKVSKELIFCLMEAAACTGGPWRSRGAGGSGLVPSGSGRESKALPLRLFKVWRNQAGLGATGGPFFSVLLAAAEAAAVGLGGGPCTLSSPRLGRSLMAGLNRVFMQSDMRTQGSSGGVGSPQSTCACLWSCWGFSGDPRTPGDRKA